MEYPAKVRSFTDLHVWQQGHVFVLNIYKETKLFPKDEQFGLTNQLRRAAVSFTSNIAEGFRRESYKDKVRFYYMAFGSLSEIQNQLLIARDLCFLSKDDFSKLAEQTVDLSKMIKGLIKSSQDKK